MLVVPEDPALIWEKPTRDRPRRGSDPAEPAPPPPPPPTEVVGERISLREAHHRFGVAVSTLRTWVRSGKIDGALEEGRWMVAPSSVAAHLSERRRSSRARAASVPEPASGPAPDGTSMLVPRDAWDKLMDQLGNLHEAGQQLAVARERAAKAETEALFLRERLGDMREERDRLRERVDERASNPPAEAAGGFWARVQRALRGGG
jgi:hypothetical protein